MNESELVNAVAKELFVHVIAANGGIHTPPETTKIAHSVYELARAFASVAKKQPANKANFQVFAVR